MRNVILTVFSFILLSVMYDDDEVSVDTMRKEIFEFRFHALFVDTSFIVMFDSEVKENELTITVLKSEDIINSEILAVHIKAIIIKDDLTAAVWTTDVKVFVIKTVIREEVKAVDVETSSIKDEIEVEVWTVTEEVKQMNVIWTVLMNRDKKKRCR